MTDYKDRMIKEFNELSIKVAKLSDFLNTDKCILLDNEDLSLLRKQLEYMSGYMRTLSCRIDRFK